MKKSQKNTSSLKSESKNKTKWAFPKFSVN